MSFFLRNLFGGQSRLGVDIGTTSIKFVEISKNSDKRPKLCNYGLLETYGYLERFNNALQTSSLKLVEQETAAYLKTLLKRAGIKTSRVVASVPAFSAFTTLIEFPLMPEKEVSDVMAFQAKQYIPLPVSAVAFDWIKVGEKEDKEGNKKQQILLIAIPNEQIERLQNIFKLAGLELSALEMEGVSSARALTPDTKEPALIVDIGARSTVISVAQEGALKYCNQTDFAGGSLTQSLASGLNIVPRRAEDLKKQRGLLGVGGEYELSTVMLPLLDVIINDAKRTKENYENIYSEKIAGVILSGGGANLLGIEKEFGQLLGLPVKKAQPFDKIDYPPAIEPIVKELGSAFSVAIGLGIREMV